MFTKNILVSPLGYLVGLAIGISVSELVVTMSFNHRLKDQIDHVDRSNRVGASYAELIRKLSEDRKDKPENPDGQEETKENK